MVLKIKAYKIKPFLPEIVYTFTKHNHIIVKPKHFKFIGKQKKNIIYIF